MSYYDDLIKKIDSLIQEKNYQEASSLINKELSMPYVPRDIESMLSNKLKNIPISNETKSMQDEDIVLYLKGDETKQLRAIEELNRRNLRDYIDICNEYLKSDSYINAKVLLIESLLRQEISEEITMSQDGVEYTFIPKYIVPPEMSDGYVEAVNILNNKFMKEPSKFELAKQLIYKDCLLALPLSYNKDEGTLLAEKAFEFIEDAFK